MSRFVRVLLVTVVAVAGLYLSLHASIVAGIYIERFIIFGPGGQCAPATGWQGCGREYDEVYLIMFGVPLWILSWCIIIFWAGKSVGKIVKEGPA
jgi:hypothetical protein